MAKGKTVEIKNRKASFEYEFLERYTAGIVLCGSEIKSIRAGKASLVDAYCYFSAAGELFVRSMNVAEYWWASAFSRGSSSATGQSGSDSATRTIRFSAQLRFTAVGREELR